MMLRDMLAELMLYLKWGIISRNTTSPWLSPINMVRKPDGTYRVTVDDKYMNRQREPWRGHPLKDRAQLEMFFLHVVALGMADMFKGFWQCRLHKDSRQYHVMWTPFGHFEWNVLCMGDYNSAHHFQHLMENVFQPFLYREPAGTVQYIDDGAQYGKNSTDPHGVKIADRHPDALDGEDDAWYFLADHWEKVLL